MDCFSKNKTRKDGYSNTCKQCFKIYRDKHYLDNKQYYKDKAKNYRNKSIDNFIEFKKTLSCSVCGESRWWVLDFHHRDPKEKEYNIATLMRSSTMNRILKELSKCEILCSNCHRDLHHRIK